MYGIIGAEAVGLTTVLWAERSACPVQVQEKRQLKSANKSTTIIATIGTPLVDSQ